MPSKELKQMKCGACGEGLYTIWAEGEDLNKIYLRCIKCNSVTSIQPEPVKLDLGWENEFNSLLESKGMICLMD
jgi:hypothetical protein